MIGWTRKSRKALRNIVAAYKRITVEAANRRRRAGDVEAS
jgi:hypothetical protein